MKKCLMVLALLALGCSFAAAQAPGTYSFWDAAGTLEYCNYNVITTNSLGVVAGLDRFTNCGGSYDSAIVGFDASTPSLGQPAHGKGAVVGDGIYDASCICYSGLQWTVWQSAKTSKIKHGFFTGACRAGLALLEATLARTSATTLATSAPAIPRARC